MPTGNATWRRCRRCERTLPKVSSVARPGRPPLRTIHPKAFDVHPTGQTRLKTHRGMPTATTQYEWECRTCGHKWWSKYSR